MEELQNLLTQATATFNAIEKEFMLDEELALCIEMDEALAAMQAELDKINNPRIAD